MRVEGREGVGGGYRMPQAPGGDISRFDYDQARREAPAALTELAGRDHRAATARSPSRSAILSTTYRASRPTPWIIPEDMAYWK